MKVLVISSSPRKGGNSETICARFIDGATDAGHETELIRLSEKQIGFCRGCYACGTTQRCVQKDDMAELIEKLIAADVIVLSTPVYFYCMSAQLKTFIDRSLPRYRDIKNKRFYYIITAADAPLSAAEGTIAGLRGYLQCLPGSREEGIIYGLGAWEKGDIAGHRALQEAYDAGKAL